MTDVIAHRGAHRGAQRGPGAGVRENTVEAFLEARRLGADMVELDVRLTADGAVVVHHDAVIPRVGLIADVPMAALPGWVPSLAEALDACEGMAVNVEVKALPMEPDADSAPVLAAAVAAVAAERQDLLVSCFRVATVDQVKAAQPGVRTALLTSAGWDQRRSVEIACERGHDALHPADAAVDAALVALAHERGLVVNVWTVDDPGRMAELASWGVDGIVTDDVEAAIRVLRPPAG